MSTFPKKKKKKEISIHLRCTEVKAELSETEPQWIKLCVSVVVFCVN